MKLFLASPRTQLQAHAVSGCDVLLSYGCYAGFLDRYQQSFRDILIDSGAYSELTGNAKVDLGAYSEWVKRWEGRALAVAGLDDISGDWRRSLKNYEAGPGFPTFHDTDPPELLADLIPFAKERGGWLGVGLKPPRHGKRDFLERTLSRIPGDIHVHGWACVAYWELPFSSVDSTTWFRAAMRHRKSLHWLTYAECLEIEVKRQLRRTRVLKAPAGGQLEFFDE